MGHVSGASPLCREQAPGLKARDPHFLQHGRLLTPEEKGETKAFVQIDEDAELKAKETTLNKVRIEEIAAEGMAAASKELAEEEKKERRDPDSINANGCMDRAEDKKEAKIPKTQDLGNLNSLFS